MKSKVSGQRKLITFTKLNLSEFCVSQSIANELVLKNWKAREEWENISRGNVALIKYLSITKFLSEREAIKRASLCIKCKFSTAISL